MTGKEKCERLKRMREQIAIEYGIEGFTYTECQYEGKCDGICPACEEETKRLRSLIQEAKDSKKKIVQLELPETKEHVIRTMGDICAPEIINGQMERPIYVMRGKVKNTRLDNQTKEDLSNNHKRGLLGKKKGED